MCKNRTHVIDRWIQTTNSVAAAITEDAAAGRGCAATAISHLEDCDALVCEILQLQMDLDCKRIDYGLLTLLYK